jgi:hypothetical protein
MMLFFRGPVAECETAKSKKEAERELLNKEENDFISN